MNWLAVGLGGGLAGVVLVAITAFILDLKLVRKDDTDAARATAAELELKTANEAIAINEKSIAALKTENSDLTSKNDSLAARAAASEKQYNDLLASVEANAPGALPDALRNELERLRALSAGPTPAPTGDPPGGEAGGVHGAAGAIKHP